MPSAIIIGAGVAGLAAAIRLRLKGYDVTVIEANDYVGGKLAEIDLDGYRFDAGPSLFTMPSLVDELFELAGKNPADYFQYRQLGLICRYFYEDGLVLNAWSDPERFAEEVEEKTDASKTQVLKLLQKSKRIYDITAHVFLFRSLHRMKTYLRWQTVKSLLRFPQIDPLRTMHRANQQAFSDPRLVQLFDRYATYNGSNPYQSPATLSVIPHLEFGQGAYLPEGGLVAIPKALHRLGEELGVKYRLGTQVSRIEVEGDAVTGVVVGSQRQPFELVVSNMDVVPTYRKLLPKLPAPERTLSQPRSSSALIFYWAISRTFSQIQLHNIFFSQDYQAEFEHLWDQKTVYHDPTVYVFVSSKALPEDAPEGCENWFVMINVPANEGQDWDRIIEEARSNIWAKLSRILGEPVAPHIAAEDILDPRSIEARTSSYQGALYGSSSNNRFAAFLRHPNFHSKLKGLYFVGGSVHPGGGIPLSLLSAKIATENLSL